MQVNHAHCFFEQSGTFRDQFIALGIPAIDYDIANDFGNTDVVTDLFAQIERAFAGRVSIFDTILEDDIILAFFPCTFFCEHNVMFFSGTNKNFRGFSESKKLQLIIDRAHQRNRNYILLLKLCEVVVTRRLRLIIENPYNPHHFLRYNFPYKPAVIDMNRRVAGDYFKKPTQYIFVNCSPAGKKSIQFDKPMKFVQHQTTIERSMISPDYARNFICDHILGIESGHSQPTLFDNQNY